MSSINSNFILIELDEKRDLHIILIYSKKIKNRVNLVESLKYVIQMLNAYPQPIQEYINLPCFGQKTIEYWYETSDSYLFKIRVPENYIPNLI